MHSPLVRLVRLSTLALACGVAGVGRAAESESELAARAAAVHARIFTLDTHIDTPTLSLRRPGWSMAERHAAVPDFSQVDFPRMRDGGLKAGVFVVYVDHGSRTPEGYAAVRDNALRTFLRIQRMTAQFPGECELALTAADGPRIAASGKRAVYISVENGYAIGRDLTLLKTFHDLGARFFGVAHNGHTDLADAAMEVQPAEWGGLSPLGREAVAECNRLGIVLDGSHASDAAALELIAGSKTPVMLTHSACRAVREHKRNAPDEVLRALAAKGGVIQVNAVSLFLAEFPPNPELEAANVRAMQRARERPTSDAESALRAVERYRARHERGGPRATFEDFLKHLFHAIDVAGVDHVGIGADMDGGGGVTGLEDVSAYPKITHALLQRGRSEEDVAKIWGGNALRVLRAAEEFARTAAQEGAAKAAATVKFKVDESRAAARVQARTRALRERREGRDEIYDDEHEDVAERNCRAARRAGRGLSGGSRRLPARRSAACAGGGA